MKLFVKKEHGDSYNEYFLADWYGGYIQIWEEWSQLGKPNQYNWIYFTFLEVRLEIERQLGDGFTIELGLLGFRIRIYHMFNTSEYGKDLLKITEKAHKKRGKKK